MTEAAPASTVSISIGGGCPAADEQAVLDAVNAALPSLAAAGLVGSGSFFSSTLGAVSLTVGSSQPPAPTLEQSVTDLAAAVTAAPAPAADGSVTLTADQWTALTTAATEVENAAVTAPSATQSADAGVPAADAAEAPTLASGDAVAL